MNVDGITANAEFSPSKITFCPAVEAVYQLKKKFIPANFLAYFDLCYIMGEIIRVPYAIDA